MKKMIAFCLALVLSAFLVACDGSESSGKSSADEVVSTATSEAESEMTVIISTPYADLKVPALYSAEVKSSVTSDDPYTVTFSSSEGTELFSFVFNGEGDSLIGTIVGKEDNTVIYLNTAEFNKKDENYEANIQLQDLSGEIITQLKKDYDLILNVAEEREDDTTFDIKTDVVTLKYPARWKDKVTVTVTEDAAAFSFGDTKLFDVAFVKSDGAFLIGEYQDTPVYLMFYELEKGKLSEEQFAEVNMMQEDHSVILDHLKEESDFVFSSEQ